MSIPTHSPTSQSSPPPNEKWYDRYPRWVQVSVPAVVGIILAVGITGWVTSRSVEPPVEVMPIPGIDPDGFGQMADGCLGGDEDLNQALLTAHEEAPLTEAGAASFAATFYRFDFTLPRPQEVTAAKVAIDDSVDLEAIGYGENRELPESLKGMRRDMSFIPQSNGYYIVTDFTGDRATVEVLGSSAASKGLESANMRVQGKLDLAAKDGHWQVVEDDYTSPLTQEEADAGVARIEATGVPFGGGC